MDDLKWNLPVPIERASARGRGHAETTVSVVSYGTLPDEIDLDAPRHSKPVYPPVAAKMGVVVEHRGSGKVGAILSFKPQQVVIRDLSLIHI